LVENGANENVEGLFGKIPLFLACKNGNENLVKYLIKKKTDVNKKKKWEETPLFDACECR